MKMMLTCKEAGQLIADSQDRHLGFMEWFSLRFHLMMCDICPFYERQLAVLRSLMSRWGKTASEQDSAVLPCLPDEARARITDAIRRAR